MATKKMGYEGKLYVGTAGSTATNELTNSRDIHFEFDVEWCDTTVRGDGSAVPIETQRPVLRRVSLKWTMIVKSDDTNLATLRNAEYVCTPVALRTLDYSGGKGVDADFYITSNHGKPIKGEQTIEFTAKPTDESRTPEPYA